MVASIRSFQWEPSRVLTIAIQSYEYHNAPDHFVTLFRACLSYRRQCVFGFRQRPKTPAETNRAGQEQRIISDGPPDPQSFGLSMRLPPVKIIIVPHPSPQPGQPAPITI